VAATSRWVLTLDADVCPAPLLASSLLAQAQKTGLAALSIATLQEIEGPGQGALHRSPAHWWLPGTLSASTRLIPL
jgi:hypothetical protein